MIECPKCGFKQPDDQYCANCGVNMKTYKPPVPPIHQRLLRSPAVHVVLLVAMVFGVYSYIKEQRAEELNERIEFLQKGERRSVFRKRADQPQAEKIRPKVEPTQETTSRRMKYEGTAKVQDLKVTATEIPADTEEIQTELALPTSFQVRIGEIDTDTLSDWLERSQETGNFFASGDMAVGIIPVDMINGLRQKKQWSKPIGKDSIEMFFGVEESNNLPELGFRVYTQITTMTEALNIDLEVLRQIPVIEEDSVFSDRQAIKEQVNIKSNEAVFVIGLLPPPTQIAEELHEFYPRALDTMLKDTYQNREVELVLTLTTP